MYVCVYQCRFKVGSLQVGSDRNKSGRIGTSRNRVASSRVGSRFVSLRFASRFVSSSHPTPFVCSHCMSTSSRLLCAEGRRIRGDIICTCLMITGPLKHSPLFPPPLSKTLQRGVLNAIQRWRGR